MLIGTYRRPLSSIFFDDDNANEILINLKHVNEQLSGKIKIKFEYRTQQKEKVEFDLHRNTLTGKTEEQKQAITLNEKKRGICYLKL